MQQRKGNTAQIIAHVLLFIHLLSISTLAKSLPQTPVCGPVPRVKPDKLDSSRCSGRGAGRYHCRQRGVMGPRTRPPADVGAGRAVAALGAAGSGCAAAHWESRLLETGRGGRGVVHTVGHPLVPRPQKRIKAGTDAPCGLVLRMGQSLDLRAEIGASRLSAVGGGLTPSLLPSAHLRAGVGEEPGGARQLALTETGAP